MHLDVKKTTYIYTQSGSDDIKIKKYFAYHIAGPDRQSANLLF